MDCLLRSKHRLGLCLAMLFASQTGCGTAGDAGLDIAGDVGPDVAGEAGQDVEGSGPIVLSGAVQKGPFVLGSSVSISLLDSSGNPTGQVFNTQTTNDLGEFEATIDALGPVSLEGSGFYWNEVTGQLSGANLTLRAYHQLSLAGTQQAYINIITHLSYNRVASLLATGASHAEAISQAEAELRAALGIGPPGFDPAADGIEMSILGGDSAANAYLLAVSAVLAKAAEQRGQGGPMGNIDASLQELINTIANDLADDGAISAELTAELDQAERLLDGDRVMERLAARLDDLGSSATVPNIHVALDSDLDTVVNLDDNCRYVENADQTDANGDGVGDVCEYRFKQISALNWSACGVLADDGTVMCWLMGGAGPTADTRLPELMGTPLGSFEQIDAGDYFGCGVRADSSLECWDFGRGPEPPRALPAGSFSQVSVSTERVCGRRVDGSVSCAVEPMPPDDQSSFVDVPGTYSDFAIGNELFCGILEGDGSLRCWAYTPDQLAPLLEVGGLPDGPFSQLDVTREAGCAIRSGDGSINCWARDDPGDPARAPLPPPAGGFSMVSLAEDLAGGSYACAVGSDGTIACWLVLEPPLPGLSQAPPDAPTNLTFAAVAAGREQACGLDTEGFIHCW